MYSDMVLDLNSYSWVKLESDVGQAILFWSSSVQENSSANCPLSALWATKIASFSALSVSSGSIL